MVKVRAETRVKNGRNCQHWTDGDRSQDTDSRARQVVRSASKRQMTGGAKGRDKHDGYSRNKNILLPEAAAGIPGAFECLLRQERTLSGACLGLVLGTKGRYLRGQRSPLLQDCGTGHSQ